MNVSRAGRIATLLAGSIAPALAPADLADVFPAPAEAARADERTVGVQLGRDARRFDLLDDVGESLGLAAGLRIVPIVAANDVQAVYDLLYLDGTDLAIVRADSIEYVRREAGLGGVRRLVRDVARLGSERIVVVAHESLPDLEALDGRTVAFGRPGSGEFVTGTLLFGTLGIDVEPVEGEGVEALERVRSGELAAMVLLLGAPDPFGHGANGPPDGVRALALPRDGSLAALYRPATLEATDLPGLAAAGAVPTWSVDLNLVAYAWAPEHARTPRVQRFVEALVDRAEELGDDVSEPEWRSVELAPGTPNLEGSPLVGLALERRAATLERLSEEGRRAERIPETLSRVPQVRTVGDGRALDRSGGGAEAGGAGGLFDGLEGLLTRPAASPSAAPSAAPSEAATPLGDDATIGARDAAQPQNSTTSR